MKKMLLVPLLSVSLVFSTQQVQAQCPLRCPTVKTVGLTATAAGFTFLSAAYIQYRQEQSDAADAALLESSAKSFKPSFLNNEKVVSTTAAVKKFLKFATKIYVNAHRPSTYNATFEAYPKLTVLAWSCDAAVFAACVKAYANHNKAKADAQEAEEKAAAEKAAADKVIADAKIAAKEAAKVQAAAQKAIEEAAKKTAEETAATEAARANNAPVKTVAVLLQERKATIEANLVQINKALETADESTKIALEAKKEAAKDEQKDATEQYNVEVARLQKNTKAAAAVRLAAHNILYVSDTRKLDAKGTVDEKNGTLNTTSSRGTVYSAEGYKKFRDGEKDEAKKARANKAYQSALAAFNEADKAHKACLAAEAALAPVVAAKPAVVPVGKPVVAPVKK